MGRGLSAVLIGITLLALAAGVPAYADEAPPPGASVPPPPPPPPLPSGPARATPVLRVRPCPTPAQAPPVAQFDRTVRGVTQRSSVVPSECLAACRKPCVQPAKKQPPGYAGATLQAYPGLGFGLEFGMWFCRTSVADLAWEVNLNYQDLTDGFNNIATGQSGKWMGARLGIKASFCPQGTSHATLRAGVAWNVATGDTTNAYDIGDIPDTPFAVNYFGGYLGIGWEWDLFGGCVTTGPEIWGFAGPLADRTQGDDGAYTATIAWHVILNF